MNDIRQEFEKKQKPGKTLKFCSETDRYIPVDPENANKKHWYTLNYKWFEFRRGYQAAHKAQQAEIERLKAEMKWMFEVGHWDIEHIQRIEQALEGNQ